MRWGEVPFPKEHGGWAIFLIPLLIGTAAGGKFTGSTVLFVFAALFAFTARAPLVSMVLGVPAGKSPEVWRRNLWIWFLTYSGMSLLFLFPLLALYQRPLLLLIGGAGLSFLPFHLRAVRERRDRALSNQLLAAVGLTLTAPGAYYVATGVLDSRALILWILNAAFFGSEVCYVQMRVQSLRLRRPILRGTACTAFAAILAGVFVLSLFSFLPPAFLLPFVPSPLKALWSALKSSRRFQIKRLGWLGVAHAMGFVGLCLLSWSLVY
ncbi:MAG: YwiC-like family protein [Candidatus Tectomicrobia bacterium]|uniref:YwiC-like family protein n=1 Tax=Tectimicrobiota bacterium TaxID=2528274 RepID=A0A932GRA3_UNCTE|nr:YwiC-like family protein [Candidatus Tectomicrobia bacterium]